MMISGCTALGTATGIGASVGIAASQEGGFSRATSDFRIQAEINDLWFKSDVESFLKLDMTVNQGRVLVTGVVQDPEQRVEAIRLAWRPEGVKQVINEIQIAESGGFLGLAKDAWIATRLRTALTLDRNIQSINYSIDTVRGVVYLIGAAQNRLELNRVIETARTIPDVKRVVSYVKLVGKTISESTEVPITKSQQDSTGLFSDEADYSQQSYTQGNNDDSTQYSGQARNMPQPLIESETLSP